MAETTNLSNNYVVDDQVVEPETQSNQQTSNASDTETITVGHDVNNSNNVQTKQTTLQELPQTGINTQNQPPFMMVSASLFLIAAGILLGFSRRGGEA